METIILKILIIGARVPNSYHIRSADTSGYDSLYEYIKGGAEKGIQYLNENKRQD